VPTVHAQITRQATAADPARDYSVNNVYHTIDDTGFNPSVDYQNHANELKDLFSGHASGSGSSFVLYNTGMLTVKVYDLADPKPRLPKATAIYTPATWATSPIGPRQVALVLSYWGVNPDVKTDRGRIYIGPLVSSAAEFPSTTVMNMLLDLGHGLFDIGGENVAHVVHSHKLNSNTVVSHYWVNDVWDTQRRRLQHEKSRVMLAP
jgi:hypothetical protein